MISAEAEEHEFRWPASTRLQGIWARERTGGAKGTLASRVSYTIPRRLDFRIPGHMLKKSNILCYVTAFRRRENV